MQIIIIGGGASALMLASLLPKKSVIIVEKNCVPGAKIVVSGGGKCNMTNALMAPEYFLGDQTFMEYALKMFDQNALLQWLKKRGLEPVIKKGSQYFCKESARELLQLLQKESQKQTFLYNETVLSVSKRESYFYVKTEKQVLTADVVVVASGGLSFPKLGASGIGYEIAKHFGHTPVKTAPALVGFTVQKEQFFFKALSGASTEVIISVNEEKCKGALLFTHKGLSGPAVLDASLYWERGKISIDFLPGFSWQTLRKSNKQLSSLLPMPKRVTKAFLLQLKLDDKAGSKITEDELVRLKSLNHYSFAPAGTFGYTKAEVTKGGVDTSEVMCRTMMSKKCEGLFFIGEVLDVTGRLGGYNFQWAFSSAVCCARFLTGRVK
jgi:predicted Rossmann fold flavoprotein